MLSRSKALVRSKTRISFWNATKKPTSSIRRAEKTIRNEGFTTVRDLIEYTWPLVRGSLPFEVEKTIAPFQCEYRPPPRSLISSCRI